MPRRHVVEPGECLARIAASAGLSGPRALLDHPPNHHLRQRLHENPNFVPVGTEVEIPDPPRHSAPARSRTRIVMPPPDEVRLRLVIEGRRGEPASNRKWKLTVGGRTVEGRLPDDGLLDELVDATDEEAQLLVWLDGDEAEPTELLLDIGMVEPADTVRGAQGRLMNLGYYDGPLHGEEDAATEKAVRAFQKANDLTATGTLDDETKRALAQHHDGVA